MILTEIGRKLKKKLSVDLFQFDPDTDSDSEPDTRINIAIRYRRRDSLFDLLIYLDKKKENQNLLYSSSMNRDDIFVSDMDFDHFDEIFRQELSRIPDKFREGVSQFIIEEKEYRYSKYMPGLYTLGQYMPRGYLGHPVVVLYFGSFKRAFPHAKPAKLKKEVAKTIAHELLHHWELKSGYDKLGEEDKKSLEEYRAKTGYNKNKPSIGQNLTEVALYIYLVFISIAVFARWVGLNF